MLFLQNSCVARLKNFMLESEIFLLLHAKDLFMIFRKTAFVLLLAPTCALAAPVQIGAAARFANTAGTSFTDSPVRIYDSGTMTGLYNLAIANNISSVNNIHMSGGNITGVNDIQMSGDLYGANDLRFTGDIVADGDLYMQGNLYGVENIHMNGGNITGAKDIDMEGNLNMSNAGNINLSDGDINSVQNINMTGAGNINGAQNINMAGSGDITGARSLTMAGGGDITGVNNIVMEGTGNLTGAVNIQMTGTLEVGNSAHIFGNLVVDGYITGSLADGDVVFGSGTSTVNAFPRYDNTTGNRIKDSPVTSDDSGNINGVNDLSMTGDINGVNTISMSGLGDIANMNNINMTGAGDLTGAVNIVMAGGNLTGAQDITVDRDLLVSGTTFINRIANTLPGSEGVTWPTNVGSIGQFLGITSAGTLGYDTPTGAGDVSATAPFTSPTPNNKIVVTDFSSGAKNIQQSNVTLDTTDNISGVATLGATTVNADTINATTGAATINADTINALTGPARINANTIFATSGVGTVTANTVYAQFVGGLTGAASLNVLKAGDTMTGALRLPDGSAATPSLNFTSAPTVGLSSSTGDLSFSTNALERMKIANNGTVSINAFTPAAGIVHNAITTGALSSSLIINADIDPAAGIVDTKLATIQTPGKVQNSATTATGNNVNEAIVARDLTGSFTASTITANLIGNVTGAASLNVLKAGDTMTGALNLATQSALNFQDLAGGDYIGLRAPATLPGNYTIELPATAPLSGQYLQALTNLGSVYTTTWANIGGSPTAGKTFYVAKNGSDSNDGSISAPFLTIEYAVSVAKIGANPFTNPITINIGAGVFTENKIVININGLSIVGSAQASTIITPSDPTDNLFEITAPYVTIANLTLQGPLPFNSTASGINIALSSYGKSRFISLAIGLFQTGISIDSSSASPAPTLFFENMQYAANTTSMHLTNAQIFLNNITFRGPLYGTTPTNAGIAITGANSFAYISGSAFLLTDTGIEMTGSAQVRLLSSTFESTNKSILCSGGSKAQITGVNFLYNSINSINLSINNAKAYLEGCMFDCESTADEHAGTAISIVNNGKVEGNACTIEEAVVGITCGSPAYSGDLSTINATGFSVIKTDTNLQQYENATLYFVGGVFDAGKLNLQDPTKVTISAFNSAHQSTLALGNNSNTSKEIYEILNGDIERPHLNYEPNYYGYRGTVYEDHSGSRVFNAIKSYGNDAAYGIITTDTTKESSIHLVSDTSGGSSGAHLRDWTIRKTGPGTDLAFTFSDNDQLLPVNERGPYDIMRLNGRDNNVEFPVATGSSLPANLTAQLLWGNDTNLYRAGANTLQTDGNFIVGTTPTTKLTINSLTPERAVVTNASNQLESSVTTTIELGYLSGVTSSVQTQLTGKVNRSGDTMTGALQLPAGTTALPSLNFTGGATAGLSSNSGDLSLSTAATERLNIAAAGALTAYAPLNLATQNSLKLQNLANTNFVGLRAPTTVDTSYTIDLPSTKPFAGQFLQAMTDSTLTWTTIGGLPTENLTFYVAFNGSDSNDGSFAYPFATVKHAVEVANDEAARANPVVINIGPGEFYEDNADGPFLISNNRISLVGASLASTLLYSTSATQDFFRITTPDAEFTNLSLIGPDNSQATAIRYESNSFGYNRFSSIAIAFFKTGLQLVSGSPSVTLVLVDNLQCSANETSVDANGVQVAIRNSLLQGSLNTPVGTGIKVSGSGTLVALLSSYLSFFDTAVAVSGGTQRVIGCNIESSNNGIVCTGGATKVVGSNFLLSNASTTHLSASGANTQLTAVGCQLQCTDANGIPRGTGVKVTSQATVILDSCDIQQAVTGIDCGQAGDLDSTSLKASGVSLVNCTTDLKQSGSATLTFVAGTYDATKLSINDHSKLSIAAFTSNGHTLLSLGNASDTPFALYQIENGEVSPPNLLYENNYYGGYKGTVYRNQADNPTFNATQAGRNNACYCVMTNDRTKQAALHLISDAGDFGTIDNVRGWEIAKTGTSAELAFGYINNDDDQDPRSLYTVMQLNGLDNKIEFPVATDLTVANTTAHLVWAGDTALYRSGDKTLTIEDNLVINGLNATGIVHTTFGAEAQPLSSSLIVNADIAAAASIQDTKLATISTSGKVANSATTATNANNPNSIVARDASGNFTANTITAATGFLGPLTGNVIGNLTGNADTASSAVNFSGTLSGNVTGGQNSTVVASVGGQTASNVAAATLLANQATSANTPSDYSKIVRRDAAGNFAGSTITATSFSGPLSGNAATATLAQHALRSDYAWSFTGQLGGDVTGLQNATTVAFVSGQSAADVAAATMLTNTSTWANTFDTLVRRNSLDGSFASGPITANLLGNASSATNATYFTTNLRGDVVGGASDTVTTVTAVGGKTAAHIATSVNDTQAATNTNTINTIVKRDGSGNFSANTITAVTRFLGPLTGAVTGNADTATTAGSATNFTGPLLGDVTGNQSATVVSTINGVAASTVSGGAALANAATKDNTATAIVRRGATGEFSAGVITATQFSGPLSGNAATATLAQHALRSDYAWSFTGQLAGDVTGLQGSTAVALVSGQTAANVAAATILANTSTWANTFDTLVRRDNSGNFSASAITASLLGNASSATNATYFTTPLSGDLIGGEYGSTATVQTVGGKTKTEIAASVNATQAAINTNTPSTIVKRYGSGGFLAGNIQATQFTGPLSGNVTGNLFGNANTATNATYFTTALGGDVSGGANGLANTVVNNVPSAATISGQTASTVAANTLLVTNASSTDQTSNTLVRRNGSGGFSAGAITATSFSGPLSGNVTGNLFGVADYASYATTSTNFTGILAGDVTGLQGSTSVYQVGGVLAASIASGANLANAATALDTDNTLVKRDSSGNFATNMITLNGTVSNPTDATTKQYVDDAVTGGLVPKTPVLATSIINTTTSGLITIDGVALSENDRVLLTQQNYTIDNGIWLAKSSYWERPTDFANGSVAQGAYVLTNSGTALIGTGWLCSTPMAIVGTDTVSFVQFSSAGQTTAANVGTGVGKIFRDKIGVVLNLKTLAGSTVNPAATGNFVTITNNTNELTFAVTATSDFANNTLVARDGSGNFAANTITANVTGAASANVLKAGDTMTGNLTLAQQKELRLGDSGSNYVGFKAPSTVGSSYSLVWPTNTPLAGQYLQALSVLGSDAQLTWTTAGGAPTSTKSYYVSLNGSDSNDGSILLPFLTVERALQEANAIANYANRVVINIGAGDFFENPLRITTDGIALVGSSISNSTILPNDPSEVEPLLTVNITSAASSTVEITNLTIDATLIGGASGTGLLINTDLPGFSLIKEASVSGFATGISLHSTTQNPAVIFEDIQCASNGITLAIDNIKAIIKSSLFLGPLLTTDPATGTGITISGANSDVALLSDFMRSFSTAISISGGAQVRTIGGNIERTINGFNCTGGETQIVGMNFILNEPTSVNVNASEVGTNVIVQGCLFDLADASETRQGTALRAANGAQVSVNASTIEEAVIGLECGIDGDITPPVIQASGLNIIETATCIRQRGTSTLKFVGGTFEIQTTDIEDASNVSFAAFNSNGSTNLALGKTSNSSQKIYEILNGATNLPSLSYDPNFYGYQGTVYQDASGAQIFNAIKATGNNARYGIITTDNTKETALRLISDMSGGSSGSNVRGWAIRKLGTSADLAFTYTDNDQGSELTKRGPYNALQLNGADNQLEFPLATGDNLPTNVTAKLVWGGDTNLYRSAANTLKTDDSFVVGTNMTVSSLATTTGLVHSDATGLLSSSLLVNADIASTAAIADTKLATISTAGKVANSATTATALNNPNTIVLRDDSGNFVANMITASLTGTASGNVLKIGDTMTGNLLMANQSEIRFGDSGSNYVGFKAPTSVDASYTISWPTTAPAANQFLQALDDTSLAWATIGGTPAATKTYYVALDGNDNNDGSILAPYRHLTKALKEANLISTATSPVAISIGAGTFAETNPTGGIPLTADGISISGSSMLSTIITPSDLDEPLLTITTPNFEISNLTIDAGAIGTSAASGITVNTNAPGVGRFNSIVVYRFLTGFDLTSVAGAPILLFENVQPRGNTTCMSINNIRVAIKDSIFLGPITGGTPANTAINATGSTSLVTILSSSLRLFTTGIIATNSAKTRLLGCNIENTENALVCAGASNTSVTGCNFTTNSATARAVSASVAGTMVNMTGCHIQGSDSDLTPLGEAIQVTTGATVIVDSSLIENINRAFLVGTTGDTNSTTLKAGGVYLVATTTDIQQNAEAAVRFIGGAFDKNKVYVNNSTDVNIAAYDRDSITGKIIFGIGNTADVAQKIYEVLNGQTNLPHLSYEPNYYGSKGTIYKNENSDATCIGVQAQSNNAHSIVVTGDRDKEAGIKLISDAGGLGDGANVRGWTISKLGTTADLAFTFTNNDDSSFALRGPYNVMQLNGLDNQLEFPTAIGDVLPANTTAKLVWAGDTNLYRSATNTLKTDDNFVVNANMTVSSLATTTGLVHSDATGLLSSSLLVNADIASNAQIADTKLATISTAGKVANSATTATALNTPNAIVTRDASGNFAANMITASLTGTASGNVLKIGDTMTGNLVMAYPSEVRFNDSGSNYVGFKAPGSIDASYSLALPTAAPVTGQLLQALSDATLTWTTLNAAPAATKTIYVALNGSDNNDGSFSAPFKTVKRAVTVADGLASLSSPVTISVGAGLFVESAAVGSPIDITASGISIEGSTLASTILAFPNASGSFFRATTADVSFSNIILRSVSSAGSSIAIDITDTSTGVSRGRFDSVGMSLFATGISINGDTGLPYIFIQNFQCTDCATNININNVQATIRTSLMQGKSDGSIANTGMVITGTSGLTAVFDSHFTNFATAVSVPDRSSMRMLGCNFETNNNSIVCSAGSVSQILGCNFILNNDSSVNITIEGSNTESSIVGCQIDGSDLNGLVQGTGIKVTNGAKGFLNSSSIKNVSLGLQCGADIDTNATRMEANAISLINCEADIDQKGSSLLNFVGGSFNLDKTTINNPANVNFAAFSTANEKSYLALGSGADVDADLYKIANGQSSRPHLMYAADYYGSKGTVYTNENDNPTFNGVQSDLNNASYYILTGKNYQEASLNLLSDSAIPGSVGNVRGWSLTKTGTEANLAFTFENNDPGIAICDAYNVARFDGVNNRVEFPTATGSNLPPSLTAQLVWGDDTNLYRDSANTLKTDDNFVIGTLAPTAGVVHNSNTGLLSSSLIVNADIAAGAAIADTKLATISTSGKVLNGATTATSLNTGSAIVARDSNGDFAARNITATSFIGSLNGNANTATSATTAGSATSFTGPLSGDVTGNQGSTVVSFVGLQSAANVAAGTQLANNATSLNTPDTIVRRAPTTGNFSAGTITASLIGNVTGQATSAVTSTTSTYFTGSLAGDVIGTEYATSVAYVGTKSAADIASTVTTVNAATNLNTANQIVRRDASGNFSATTITANLSGNATTATDAVRSTTFLGSFNGDVTGTQNATAVATVGGQTATNVAAGAVLANAATSANTNNAIVRRDANGDFAARNITATNFTGLASNATTAVNFSGSLTGDVSSTGMATTVNTVGSVSAANVASGANLANAATDANTGGAIVKRTAGGNFSAGTITANLTGAASLNVLKTGDTMSGTLTLAAGSAATPSLQFAGSTNTGFSAATANKISVDTNGAERMSVDGSGTIAVNAFTSAGIVHNAVTTGALSSSLIVNADVAAGAAISDTKLATISTALKVANSATTAASANTASAIVARDGSGNFAAGMITSSLTGMVTGTASFNVLKIGDTMTGSLTLPPGTAGSPSLKFTGGTNTGISMPSTDYLSFDTNGVERMSIDSTGTVSIPGTLVLAGGSIRSPSFKFENGTNTGLSSPVADSISFDVNGRERMNIDSTDVTVTATLVAAGPLILTDRFCNQAIQVETVTTSTARPNTSILFVNRTATGAYSITFPSNPVNGQLFTILTQNTNTITVTNYAPGATIFAASRITSLDANLALGGLTGGASVTYIYIAATNTWYRIYRG